MLVTPQNVKKILAELSSQKIFVFDVETNSLDPFLDSSRICGIGIGLMNGKTLYFPFFHKHEDSQNLEEIHLRDLISILNDAVCLIGYNIKFDLKFLVKEGLDPFDEKELLDVIVLCRMLEGERFAKLSLTESIIRNYGESAASYDNQTKQTLRKNKWINDFSTAPESVLGPYCEQDVYWTYRLYIGGIKGIIASNQKRIFTLEKQLTKVLLKAELRGIEIDREYCREALGRLQLRRSTLEQRVFEGFGGEINLASNKQIGKAFNGISIQSPVITAAGNQSWDEIVLAGLDHSIAGQIREWRTVEKMRTTYIEPFLGAGGPIRTNFCNWGTITGRLSSREPNLQNIPRFMIPVDDIKLSETQRVELEKRIEAMLRARRDGGENVQIIRGSSLMSWGFTGDEMFDDSNKTVISIRRLFVPRKGFKLISFDYSQMEVRVFLSYLRNPEIEEQMRVEGFDFHSHAAKLAFKINDDHPDFKFYRQMAKAITFGVIYGIGNKRLAIQLGCPEDEAKTYKKQYFEGISGSRKFINSVMDRAQERGYVFNRFGRRYAIPRGREYIAVNYLIQGTSADLLSDGMLKVDDYLSSIGAHILIQVHDELICEIPEESYLDFCRRTVDILEDNVLKIPLKVDAALCDPSWAHKKDLVWKN